MHSLCVIIITLLIAQSFGSSAPVLRSLKVQQKSERIVGGVASGSAGFPYQVSVQRNGFYHCSGAIFSANLVLTAAHCLIDSIPSALRVRAGSSYWSEGGQQFDVAKFKVHEEFNAATMENDIALLRLTQSLVFGPTIKSIDLATQSWVGGVWAVVSGWGSTSYNENQLTRTLQSTTVGLITREQCASSAYGYGWSIRASMICAGNSGYGACEGDDAAPLVANNLLVGLASWGIGCGFQKYPTVFADVATLSSWVYRNVGAMYD